MCNNRIVEAGIHKLRSSQSGTSRPALRTYRAAEHSGGSQPSTVTIPMPRCEYLRSTYPDFFRFETSSWLPRAVHLLHQHRRFRVVERSQQNPYPTKKTPKQSG
jgi:hypothetical protein